MPTPAQKKVAAKKEAAKRQQIASSPWTQYKGNYGNLEDWQKSILDFSGMANGPGNNQWGVNLDPSMFNNKEEMLKALQARKADIDRQAGARGNSAAPYSESYRTLNATINAMMGGQQPGGNAPGGSQPGAPGQGGTPPAQGPPLTGGPTSPGANNPNPGPGFGAPENLPYFPGMSSAGSNRLGDIYNQATTGTLQSFDTAANRLRERLDSSTKGNESTAMNKNLSRGLGNSGMNGADMFRERQAGQNAYAQGLNELLGQFEGFRQQGLQTGLNAETTNLANKNFMDKSLMDMLNSREQRGSNERMGTQQTDLQRLLAQLQEQGANYRQTVGIGGGLLGGGGIRAPGVR